MKSYKPSRILNESSVFMGLTINDLIGLSLVFVFFLVVLRRKEKIGIVDQNKWRLSIGNNAVVDNFLLNVAFHALAGIRCRQRGR